MQWQVCIEQPKSESLLQVTRTYLLHSEWLRTSCQVLTTDSQHSDDTNLVTVGAVLHCTGEVAVTRCTDVGQDIRSPIESKLTAVTLSAGRVTTARDADSAPSECRTPRIWISRSVVDTAGGVSVTLARTTGEGIDLIASTEWFVVVQRKTLVTLKQGEKDWR